MPSYMAFATIRPTTSNSRRWSRCTVPEAGLRDKRGRGRGRRGVRWTSTLSAKVCSPWVELPLVVLAEQAQLQVTGLLQEQLEEV